MYRGEISKTVYMAGMCRARAVYTSGVQKKPLSVAAF